MFGYLHRPLPPGPANAFTIVAACGASLLLVVLLLPWNSEIQARIGLAGIGVLALLLIELRPQRLWQMRDMQRLRSWVGDTGTLWLYRIVGLSFIIAAGLQPMASYSP